MLHARFSAYNSPKTVWRPGSARTRCTGELERYPRPCSRKKGGLFLREGKGREGDRMGGERTGGEGKGGERREERGKERGGEGNGRGKGPS